MLDSILYTAAHGFNATDAALALVRAGTGLFFVMSGFNKLFNEGRRAVFVQTLRRNKIPAVPFMQFWVAGWELLGGAMLVAGLFSAFAAGVLAIICLVACYSEAAERVDAFKPINVGDRIADWLYLPEVLYLFLLAVNIMAGTGRYSLDALIFPI